MENFFAKKAKPATALTNASADVEMHEAGNLMAQAAEKPKYVPWIEK